MNEKQLLAISEARGVLSQILETTAITPHLIEPAKKKPRISKAAVPSSLKDRLSPNLIYLNSASAEAFIYHEDAPLDGYRGLLCTVGGNVSCL